MSSNITPASNVQGAFNTDQVHVQIGSMGGDRDVTKFDLMAPVPSTMKELRAEHPKVYQEVLLQVFETINILIQRQMKDSQKQWKENGRPK